MSARVAITKEQALAIRETYGKGSFGGAGMLALAGRYNVSQSTVHNILTGKHVTVLGMPNIPGTRRSLKEEKLKAAPRLTAEQRRRSACDRCGAKSGERCRDPRSTLYPRYIGKLHEGRGR